MRGEGSGCTGVRVFFQSRLPTRGRREEGSEQMKIGWLMISVIAAVIPLCCGACEPASPNTNQAISARFIVRGRAMESRWVQPATLLVHVAVENVIKGRAPTALDATSPCALPVKDGETVIVFNNDGESLVYPIAVYEQDLRSALHSVRP
jgi:hypothetical protein